MSQLILQPFCCFIYTTRTSYTWPTSQLILQSFHCFTHITAYSTTLPLLHLHHSSFYNPSIASPTSQLILQPFHCFTYITAHSTTLLPLLHLRHSSFYNASVASPTSQALHLRHLAIRPCLTLSMWSSWWTNRSRGQTFQGSLVFYCLEFHLSVFSIISWVILCQRMPI